MSEQAWEKTALCWGILLQPGCGQHSQNDLNSGVYRCQAICLSPARYTIERAKMSFGPIIYVMLFLGILAILQSLYVLFFGNAMKREAVMNRRLGLLKEGSDPEDVLQQLRRERERNNQYGSVPLLSSLSHFADRANLTISMGMLVMIIGGITVAFYLIIARAFQFHIALQILVAVALAYILVLLYLQNKAAKRLAQFDEQLPDAVELVVRSLRVGHPFLAAVGTVAKEMPDPIGSEFGIVADEATYGMEIIEALDRATKRVDSQDLRYIAVAVGIQSQSGGNLAEVLEGLANVIRARYRMFRKISAITAEGRWSGWFLSVFPIAALFGVKLIKPDYYERVSDHPIFMPGVYLTFILLIVNIVFIRMLVKIKV